MVAVYCTFDMDDTFDATALRTGFLSGFVAGDVPALMEHVENRIRDNWSIAVYHGPGPARRLAEIFNEAGHTATVVDRITEPNQPIRLLSPA